MSLLGDLLLRLTFQKLIKQYTYPCCTLQTSGAGSSVPQSACLRGCGVIRSSLLRRHRAQAEERLADWMRGHRRDVQVSPRDVAISCEMSWKSCCHEVAKEEQSAEGNGL